MVTDSRLGKSEQAMRSVALAFIAQEYEINTEELEALQRLAVAIRHYGHMTTPAKAVDSFVEALADAYGKTGRDERAFSERVHELQIAAGLDPAKHYKVARQVMSEYQRPDSVTIDDLLELDRKVYEAWLAASAVHESESEE